MANDENAFREWMDGKKLKASDVAERFGVSEQTIAHWRSQGVPERRRPHVSTVIAEWNDSPPSTTHLQPLVITATREQFRRWNAAALAEGKLIEDWAIEGIDRLAAQEEEAAKAKAAATAAGPKLHVPTPEEIEEAERRRYNSRVAEGEN